jgi:spore cortex formation protein SpoVR/YcgB (stage V sporulation)
VIRQPEFDDPNYGGINPYALGFAMMQDIERLCTKPTEEDRECSPTSRAGATPWRCCATPGELRDESFIAQFLSPHLIRRWRMFHLADDPQEPDLRSRPFTTSAATGAFARCWRASRTSRGGPGHSVADVDLTGDRRSSSTTRS